MTETVSDERLRELAQGYETWSKTNSSRPQIDKDTASALRELLALRTPPQNTDGEAVAWQADWPDDPAFPEWTLNRTTAEKWHERGAMITPLVPASTLSAMKAERDGLRTALIDAGRAVGGGLADTVSSDFLAHVPSEVRMVTQNLTARAERAEAERDSWRRVAERCEAEARSHSMEARTANSTIYEIYQVLSGGKGEPGNWNGAEPAREYVARAEAERDALAKALERTLPVLEADAHKGKKQASLFVLVSELLSATLQGDAK